MTFTTRERAQGWLAGELKLIERGEWTPPAQRRRLAEARQITFDEYARDWIDNRLVRGRPIKATTRQHYLDIHDRWLAPLHDLPLDDITERHVERWYQQAFPDAPTMRSHSYSLLKSIFPHRSRCRKLIKESPVNLEGATSRTTPKDITLLTVAQVQALAGRYASTPPTLVLLAAWCGLRFGELTALRRRDLDLVEGTVTVEQAAVTVGGERVITTPKSTAGHRTVYMPPHLLDTCQHLATFTPTDADALVFQGTNDLPTHVGAGLRTSPCASTSAPGGSCTQATASTAPATRSDAPTSGSTICATSPPPWLPSAVPPPWTSCTTATATSTSPCDTKKPSTTARRNSRNA